MVEGSLTFPSDFVPAMNVYAREVDSVRLHLVSTTESQVSFKMDLPAGRYIFFAEPSQPGAPEIYGAYTQSAVCKAHKITDRCDDHSPIVYVVGAKSAAPVISDWTIPDALANEFDQLLGNRQEQGPQELGAPHFSEYPAPRGAELTAIQSLDFSGSGIAAEKQERIQEIAKSGANFAGSLALVRVPCGEYCSDAVLVDLRSGKVQAPPALAQLSHDLPCRGDESLRFRRNSRLMSITRRRDANVTTQYFVWKPENSSLLQTAEYQRSAERFCSVPARENSNP